MQVILSDEEKERFATEARRAGVSLSAWLRQAGINRLEADAKRRRMSGRELERFFGRCRKREQGSEPDWEQHLSVIERSRRSGAADS